MLINKFPSTCLRCGEDVPAGQGYWTRTRTSRGISATYCAAHGDGQPEIQTGMTQEQAIDQSKLDKAVADIAALCAAHITGDVPKLVADTLASYLPDMVAIQLAKLAPRTLEIKLGSAPPKVTVKTAHRALPTILQAVASGASVFLVGPAGSGKTTLAEQVATVLKRPFYMAARVTSEFKLTGFIDATGKCVRTQFREAYEHGGVFLFDEVDSSDPDALTTFNAGLSNGYTDFPDGMVKRHKDFVAIAAGNTFGRGADRQYVGRNQLDAATLDRFQTFEVDYDEVLEAQLAGDAEWTMYVQRVRKAVEAERVRHVVSPRASISGARMLAIGMDRGQVEESCVWKGLPAAEKSRVLSRMGAV